MDGQAFADRCAVYGQPGRLTKLQALYLDLHLARSRYTQVLTFVEALSVASGEPGELEYYKLFPGDPEKLRTQAQLRAFHRSTFT